MKSNKFPIIITKKIVFQDMHGKVLKTYEVGDIVMATQEMPEGYFVTSMGGIWTDEAKRQ